MRFLLSSPGFPPSEYWEILRASDGDAVARPVYWGKGGLGRTVRGCWRLARGPVVRRPDVPTETTQWAHRERWLIWEEAVASALSQVAPEAPPRPGAVPRAEYVQRLSEYIRRWKHLLPEEEE